MTFLSQINNKYKIVAGDLVDIKDKLKEKKAVDKEKKIESFEPKFDKASLRVSGSDAIGDNGYLLTITVPVPADYFKTKKTVAWQDAFLTKLHDFINERTGKWIGHPQAMGKDDRAKGGFINVKAKWYFEDAFLAYSLGLDLDRFGGSDNVVDKNQIASRLNIAEKAYKELEAFRDLADKKITLKSKNKTDKDERNKIWKEDCMDDWSKLSDKWKEKGIVYYKLSMTKEGKKRAVGKVEASYPYVELEIPQAAKDAVKDLMAKYFEGRK
jgi:hypothetical protein